ncbi:MAG: zinc-binding dehydrogenase [Acidimicrobiia bacterium]|nr:zinc-binding dehydrogenase [Acidimicrobiia bacterium]
MKARAAIFREIGGELSIEEVDVDEAGPDEVRVRTSACGVCHSDLHFMQGSIGGPRPTIPGHEPAGVVESVGSQVRSVKPGDHVIACTSMFCGHCAQCMLGRPHLCTDRRSCRRPKGQRPRITLDGAEIHQFADLSGFSEVMLVHERAVVRIDDDVPLDRAALVGCAVTTGVGAALNTAKVAPGSSVAVFGCGGVGTSVIQGARLAGARQIIAVDIHPAKLDVARHFGATHVLLSGDEDPVKAIKGLSGGGVDYAFDAVGNTKLSAQCLYSLAPRGLAVIVGAIPAGHKLELEPGHFYVEKSITGSIMGSNRFHIDAPRYLELYRQGRLDLDAMISARVGLGEVSDALAAMEAGEVTRSVIMFDGA